MWIYTCSVCGDQITHPEQAEARALFAVHATDKHGAKSVVMVDTEGD